MSSATTDQQITIERWAHVCQSPIGTYVVIGNLRASRDAAEADPEPIFGKHLGVWRFVGAVEEPFDA